MVMGKKEEIRNDKGKVEEKGEERDELVMRRRDGWLVQVGIG